MEFENEIRLDNQISICVFLNSFSNILHMLFNRVNLKLKMFRGKICFALTKRFDMSLALFSLFSHSASSTSSYLCINSSSLDLCDVRHLKGKLLCCILHVRGTTRAG